MFKHWIAVWMVLAGFPALAQLPAVRPVPGSGAGYVYFPAEGDSRAILKVVKESVTSVPAGMYQVYFTFGGEPEELLCDTHQTACEKTLGAGAVKLRIAGEWLAGKLSMLGKFSGACSGIDDTCQINLQAGDTQTVRIKVGCNAHDYSLVKLGGDAQALCVGTDGLNQRPDHVLLAAHKKIGGGKRAKKSKGELGNSSSEDGAGNTAILRNNWSGDTADSAAHYCHGLELGSGSTKLTEWYLPAISELDLALSGWVDEDYVVPKAAADQGYFSSTHSDKKRTQVIEWDASSIRKRTKYKYKESSQVLCVRSVAP